MLSPLYGKLALRILGGLAHLRRKPTELAIRTHAPAHRRLSLPSATQETVHHAPCSLRLAGTRPTMSGRSDDAKEAKDIVYTGKEPFEKFDRQVNRWARRRFKGLHGHIYLGGLDADDRRDEQRAAVPRGSVAMSLEQRCRSLCLLAASFTLPPRSKRDVAKVPDVRTKVAYHHTTTAPHS